MLGCAAKRIIGQVVLKEHPAGRDGPGALPQARDQRSAALRLAVEVPGQGGIRRPQSEEPRGGERAAEEATGGVRA
jgi:hypothetical protein